MPVPKFIFVRHGEAQHNVAFHEVGEGAFNDPDYKDATLTPKGIEQAQKIGEALADLNILSIWSSPLTRAIQTAEGIYEEVNANDLYLHDSLLELQGNTCDERKPSHEIKNAFGCWNTTFLSDIPAMWIQRENFTSLNRRMLAFILLLGELYKGVPEGQHVVIVSHSHAIAALTKKSLKNGEHVTLSLDEILEANK
jgi:broad specificity phosphatase PhoE